MVLRRSCGLLAWLALSSSACADRPATAIVTAIATDQETYEGIQSVRVRAYRGDTLSFEGYYRREVFRSPGSLAFHDTSDGESKVPLRLVVEGLTTTPPPERTLQGAAGLPALRPQGASAVLEPGTLVRRSASLTFAKEKSKLLRLGLDGACRNVSCLQANTTCSRGKCVDDQVDPSTLPDATGNDQLNNLGDFQDLGDGGAGGAAGGSGQGGEGGAGACPTLAGLALSADGQVIPAGGEASVDLGAKVTLQSSEGPLSAGEVTWTLSRPGGTVGALDALLAASGAQATVQLSVCVAELGVRVQRPGCDDVSATYTLRPRNMKEVYVDRASAACNDAQGCGAPLEPWCSLGAATAGLTPTTTEIRVARTVDGAYEELVRLPPGVSLRGGYPAGFSTSPQPGDVTRIQPPAGSSGGDGALPSAPGNPLKVGSTLSVGDAGVTAGQVTLSDLEVALPTSPLSGVAPEQSLQAGIHVRGGLTAELVRVSVVAGQESGQPVALAGNVEGVYISGGGAGQITLLDSTLRPPASAEQYGNGLKIDRDVMAKVRVCGDTQIQAGGAQQAGRQSVGVLVWGGASLQLAAGGQLGCPAGISQEGPKVRGGQAQNSYGAQIDADLLVQLRTATLEGFSFDGASDTAWPASLPAPRQAGLMVNPARAAQIDIDGATLVGHDSRENSPMPAEASVAGVSLTWGNPETLTVNAGFSFSANDAEILGQRGAATDPLACAAAQGVTGSVAAQFDIAPKALKFTGGTVIGGGACRGRFGLYLENFGVDARLTPASEPPHAGETRFLGSNDGLKGPDCDVSYGLRLLAYGATVQGGVYNGGDDCGQRFGILIEGDTNSVASLEAIGSDSPGGRFEVGLELMQGQLTINDCTFTGGPNELLDGQAWSEDLGSAVGLLIESHQAVSVQNSTGTGCAGCLGDVHGAGLRVDRSVGASVSSLEPTTLTNCQFTGGSAAGNLGELAGAVVRSGNRFSHANPTDPINRQFLENVRVQFVNTSLTGTDPSSPGRPVRAFGLDARAGGVSFSSPGEQRLIQAGPAVGDSIGFSLCAGYGSQPKSLDFPTCKNVQIEKSRIEAGDAPNAIGVLIERTEASNFVQNEVHAVGGPGTKLSRALVVQMNSLTIANSFFFGADESQTDVACSLEDPGPLIMTEGSFGFSHSVCAGGRASDSSVGFDFIWPALTQVKASVLLENNLVYPGSQASNRVGWFAHLQNASNVALVNVVGNRVLNDSSVPASHPVAFDVGSALTLCPGSTGSGGVFFCDDNGGVNALLGNQPNGTNGLRDVAALGLPHPGDNELLVSAWLPPGDNACLNLGLCEKSQLVTKDYSDQARVVGNCTPGPAQCP